MDTESEFLRPLVTGWLGKIELARRARAPWQEVADEAMMFYSRSAAAMWDEKYGKKFWKGVPAPKFRVTINKAFELVSVFGPNLMWGHPHRQVEGKRALEFPVEMFGDPNDPQVAEFYQQISAETQKETASDRITAELMERWLNYTVREQPGGGLAEHSTQAVTDALIKGRGILWTKPYRFPTSGRTLTGSFREAPENLFIDPDYTTLDDAKWIAIRRVAPTWEVERRFRLKKDSLKNRSTLESSWAEAELRSSTDYEASKLDGRSNDMIVYYEVWSKTGPGSRLTGMKMDIKDHLEQTVGDFAWIVVAPDVPFPLNCPSAEMRAGASTEEIRDKFSWPVDCWADGRWPISVLDFYENPDSAWPIAPLAPAMGELKFLNVMIPHLMNRIWSSSRDFWAVSAAAYSDFLDHLKRGEDQTVFKIPVTLGGSMKDHIGVFQQPQTNLDVWRIIEAVSVMFDKRTGLTDFMYGTNSGGTQDRTAETTMARREQSGVRPQFMRERVKLWQDNVASLEAFCARLFVTGEDVQPLMGDIGAGLWEQLIMSTDVERVARQMSYTIASSSIQRPDKEKEASNMSQAISIWLPVAQGAAASTGDYTAVNAIMKKWGEAAGVYTADIEIKGADPNEQQAQAEQMRMEMEMQKNQMEMQKLQMELQGKQMEIEGKQAQTQLDMAAKQMQAEIQSQQGQMKLGESEAKLALESFAKEQQMAYDAVAHEQDIVQDQESHKQDYRQSEEEHRQKMKQQKDLAKMQQAIARWKAKNGPKDTAVAN